MAQHAQLNDRNHSNFIPSSEINSPKYERLKALREHLLGDDSSSTTEKKYPEEVTFRQNQAALNAPIIYPNLDLDQNYTDLPASIDEKPKADLPDNGRKIREKVQKKLQSDVIRKLKEVFSDSDTEITDICKQFNDMVGSIEKPESSQEMLHFIDWCTCYIESQTSYSTITLTRKQTRALNKVLSTLGKVRKQIGILEPTDKKQLFQPASVEKAKHNLLSAIQNYNRLFPKIEKVFLNRDGTKGHGYCMYSCVKPIESIMQPLEQQITDHDFLKECMNQTEFSASISELQKLVAENMEKIMKAVNSFESWFEDCGNGKLKDAEGSAFHCIYLLQEDPLRQVMEAFADYQTALEEHFVMKTIIIRPKEDKNNSF